jgi:hypothetical protein
MAHSASSFFATCSAEELKLIIDALKGPLLAQSGHPVSAGQCPLLGE